jgi:hypothetical protein
MNKPKKTPRERKIARALKEAYIAVKIKFYKMTRKEAVQEWIAEGKEDW